MNTIKAQNRLVVLCLLLLLASLNAAAESPMGPLNNPLGWHLVNAKGVEVLKDDTRYAQSKNWILFVATSLASEHPEFVGETTMQGAWSIKRQDFSIQILSLAKESNCKIWSKEYNTSIYKPARILLGDRTVWAYQSSKQFQEVYTPAERACEIASVRTRTCEVIKCKKWAAEEDDLDTYLVKDENDARQLYKKLTDN